MWAPPPENWDSQERVGKTSRRSSIKTSVTQMTRNNELFSIQVSVSPPPNNHVPPTSRHNPIGPRRTPTDTIGLLVPGRNRDPVLANWVFVLAQSVVALWENETWKPYYGGWRKTGRLKRGDRFWRHKAPDALPGSIMMPYRGSRWFRRSNCEDTKQDGDRPKMETHTNTYMQMQAHTHSHIRPLIRCLKPVTHLLFQVIFSERLRETFQSVKQGRNKVEYVSIFIFVVKKYIRSGRTPLNQWKWKCFASASCASIESDCSPESLREGERRRMGHEPALCLIHRASTWGRRPAPLCL